MSKYDQKVLNYLKGAKKGVTVTQMITGVKMGVMDIEASLNSLLAQGLVGKEQDNQGVEYWFHKSRVSSPSYAPIQAPIGPSNPQLSASLSGSHPLPPSLTGIHSSPVSAVAPPLAPIVLSGGGGGVSATVFMFSLLIAVAAAAFIGGKIGTIALEKASKNFVEQKVMNEAINSWADFEVKMRGRVTGLETNVKQLNIEIDSLRLANEELQKQSRTAAKPSSKRKRSRR